MMKSIKTILLVSMTSFLFLLAGCEKDSGPEIRPLPVDTTHIVSFSQEIQPIFDDRCIVCHNQFHPFLDLRIGHSYNELLYGGFNAPYVNVQEPEQSLLYQHVCGITAAIMPPNGEPLSDNQIALILQWIRQGALEN